MTITLVAGAGQGFESPSDQAKLIADPPRSALEYELFLRMVFSALASAGVERVPRVEGVVDGEPQLADGRVLDVAVVMWVTGFRLYFGWIELPISDDGGYPMSHRGVVDAAPGLYFLGLPFQYTPTSEHVGGVGRDAQYISEHIAARSPAWPARRRGAYLPMEVDQKA